MCVSFFTKSKYFGRNSKFFLWQPVLEHVVHFLEKMKGFVDPPIIDIHQFNITVKLGSFEIILRLLRHIKGNDPAVLLIEFVVPFFVIVPVAAVKIEYVFQ